ncbi:hypothetical protein [Brevifollis gellanilyticus]|nr:hypothetical protein [Brevifollis gellanilyticus]
MNLKFDHWREELIFTGNIVQDDDESVPQDEKERRFNRYVELLGSVTGAEGLETLVAVVDSLQAEQDYGAYQRTYNTLWCFPPNVAAEGLVTALPGLIQRRHDCAGNILAALGNATSGSSYGVLLAFRQALASTSQQARTAIMDFITREEHDGWLDGRRKGVIRPAAPQPT